MFFRRHIHSTCYNSAVHIFPVTMRFGGRQFLYGRLVYVMYCPVCSCQHCFEYHGTRIRQVA